ncbi:34-kDa subunit of RNA polymerase III (C) [Thelotrema lepadinum]|nr:34-kDa subunit of RNA polymerase III (C) [Thelotrema lepadinum]
MAAESKVEIQDELNGIKHLCSIIHAVCVAQPLEKLWFQEDFLDLNVIPSGDLEKLQQCIQGLSSEGLLKLHKKDGITCWRVVTRENAAKYRNLSAEEAMIYSHIDSSGKDGIWARTLRLRSNLHEAVCKTCLKSLENKRLIKQFKNPKQPRSKFYISTSLQHSDKESGTTLKTEDGEWDEVFIDHLHLWIRDYVHRNCWYEVTPEQDKLSSEETPSKEDAEAARAEALRHPSKITWLPLPPGYKEYPTIPEITKALHDSKVFNVEVPETDVFHLLELLTWDQLIEKAPNMDGRGYKTLGPVYTVGMDDPESTVAQSPCTRCPVFDFCDDSGPVNAKTCPYFKDWLGN